MADAAAVSRLGKAAKSYAKDIKALVAAGSTTEATYYPAVRSLIAAALAAEELPFDVRINTSEKKAEGGINLPDVALYDADGEFLVVCGEVKLPEADLQKLALSTENKDQIGRYLASTRAALISNVRSFALVTVNPGWKGSGPVPPDSRRVEQVVEFWPGTDAIKQGQPIEPAAIDAFVELIETAVTRFAPIADPQSLARILARQARRAKADLPEKFTHAVQGLLDDFGKALGVTFVGPEGEEFLRSSLIQTAFYGLFAGWALWWQGKRKKPFAWEDLSDYLKIPFLGSLFHEFRHPSRIKELRLAKHLDIATETLARVDAEVFFKRFRLPDITQEDTATTAIMHFYEPFLEAFDPDLRKELGVWYTPTPIVRYQVGKIDKLLREELGCPRGFADERVIVLDPACGTGAYLVEALRHTAEQLEKDGAGDTLPARLLDAVCRRFIGFEILTAPFVVAQLQLYLLLARLGAAPDEKHRPAVFLTNALTGWHGPDQLKLNFPELQDEHDAAREVKRDAKVIVVLGNPPYNRFAGVPLDEEADLVDFYKGITRGPDGKQAGQTGLFSKWGVRKHLLDDLYIRFFRLAEIRIGQKAEFGIVSFISNSSYLVGRSHPIMREALLGDFDRIWIDNLHGNRIASERTPWGDSCQTIFNTEEIGPGIKVGTCISTLLKTPGPHTGTAKLFVRDFWGRAEGKRAALEAALTMDGWTAADKDTAAKRPEGPRPYEEFTPTKAAGWRFAPSAKSGYEDWPAFDDLFPRWFQGVNPNRGLDGSVIDTARGALEKRMRDYFSDEVTFGDLSKRYPALVEERARFEPKKVRERLRKESKYEKGKVLPYILFPFDARWIYYEPEAKFLNEARPELGQHLAENEFLVGVPQPRRVSESRPFVLSTLFDLHLHDWGSVGFPAEVKPDEGIGGLFKPEPEELVPSANLTEGVWNALRNAWGLKGDLRGKAAKRLCRDLFRYCAAIAHAPQYESDHKDSLLQEWPRVPIPKSKADFDEIVGVGARLAALLDPIADASSAINGLIGKDAKGLGVATRVGGGAIKDSELLVEYSYYGAATGRWQERSVTEKESSRAEWGTSSGDLYLNENVFLAHVPPAIWRYELGGYPVLKKWLGYRQSSRRDDAPLSLAELDHLRSIIQRIAAILTLRASLDAAYEKATADSWSLDELTSATGAAKV